jgi:hypothetical protein
MISITLAENPAKATGFGTSFDWRHLEPDKFASPDTVRGQVGRSDRFTATALVKRITNHSSPYRKLYASTKQKLKGRICQIS